MEYALVMMEIPSLRKEARYGIPAADKIIFNRYYVLGYSYYFRQAKWALEIVDPDSSDVERANNFRPDYRISSIFRADLTDYENSGFDRGHLIASANQIETEIQNSETFLLSNMLPQEPGFNRQIWKKLESAVRKLNAQPKILETYVVSGPIFFFDTEIKTIGSKDDNGVSLPIPHAFFKSILTENNKGTLHMWSFIIPNEFTNKPLEEFQVKTTKVELYSGLFLWEHLVGSKIKREKNYIRKIWKI